MNKYTRLICQIFTRRHKIAITGFLLLSIIQSCMEALGLLSVIPFMTILMQPELVNDVDYIRFIYDFLNFKSVPEFQLFLGIVVFVFLVLSNCLVMLNIYINSRVSHSVSARISSFLFGYYICQDYPFHLCNDNVSLIKRISTDGTIMATHIILPLFNFVSKILTTLVIIVLILMVDPVVGSGLILITCSAYFFIFIIVKNKLKRNSEIISEWSHKKTRLMLESFAGIKDIKLYGLEQQCYARYASLDRYMAIVHGSSTSIRGIPRYLVEIVMMGSAMAVCLLYLRSATMDIGTVLPKITFFVFSAYRVVPNIQAIFNNFASIKSGARSFDLIREDIMKSQHQPGSALETKNVPVFSKTISLDKISYKYPQSEEYIFQDFSIVFKKGCTYGIVGTTGCGKTTLLDIILGYLPVSNGKISVDDTSITNANATAWRSQIGYVFQNIFLTNATIAENIAFGYDLEDINHARLERAAKRAQIHSFIMRLPLQYNTIVGERGIKLSGGQIQRIGVARALYTDSEILILDEATSAIDGETESIMMDSVITNIKQEITSIIVTHRLSTVKMCDYIFLIDKGKISNQGTYDQLIKDSISFRKMANIDTSSKI